MADLHGTGRRGDECASKLFTGLCQVHSSLLGALVNCCFNFVGLASRRVLRAHHSS